MFKNQKTRLYQEFCDYDKKNAYKNLSFGTSFDFVSSRFNLTKSPTNPNDYNSTVEEAVFWGNVKFDDCLFQFNSEKKLTGVQLRMIGHGSTDAEKKKKNLFAWFRIEEYLTKLFGKPQNFDGNHIWLGENIYIVMENYAGKRESDGAGALAIISKNINPIDGL